VVIGGSGRIRGKTEYTEIEKTREKERKESLKIMVSLEGPYITGRKLALTTQFLDKTPSESPCGSSRNTAIGRVYARTT
jgi:hypothetical protein